jgi:hypothetical protein
VRQILREREKVVIMRCHGRTSRSNESEGASLPGDSSSSIGEPLSIPGENLLGLGVLQPPALKEIPTRFCQVLSGCQFPGPRMCQESMCPRRTADRPRALTEAIWASQARVGCTTISRLRESPYLEIERGWQTMTSSRIPEGLG